MTERSSVTSADGISETLLVPSKLPKGGLPQRYPAQTWPLPQLRIFQSDRHFGQAQRRPLDRSVKNTIRHALRAQRFVALLAQHPADSVHHIGFSATVGATMQVVPVPLNVTTVRSQKDLKPKISTLRSLSKVSPFVVYFYFASGRHTSSHGIVNQQSRGICARRETTNLSSREVDPRDASVRNRQKAQTFGRFSVRASAWR